MEINAFNMTRRQAYTLASHLNYTEDYGELSIDLSAVSNPEGLSTNLSLK